MELVEDDFGWNRDLDAEGNEFYHPDLTAVATYMEMLSHGIIPELEWKSPGRRQPSTNYAASKKSYDMSSPAKVPSSEPVNRVQPPKSNPSPLSAFDFDDSEMYDASADSSSSASSNLLKVEPRKRVVATLDNVLQAVASSRPMTTSPGTIGSPAKKIKTENTIEESKFGVAIGATPEVAPILTAETTGEKFAGTYFAVGGESKNYEAPSAMNCDSQS